MSIKIPIIEGKNSYSLEFLLHLKKILSCFSENFYSQKATLTPQIPKTLTKHLRKRTSLFFQRAEVFWKT